ncbi:heme peroxidase [Rhizoclosmatium globosum]|uniref:Peroxidase n=1 Tax=Rhizoclosmatium globosum TaxID=329046 RepID=A0A1Y2BP48_9FUNG|nr:heme peroxidase [Rhizoclosmatium globosum]|eukprot:ORY36530.1 heme peroxidase [Rhizoclosmatium globosum]
MTEITVVFVLLKLSVLLFCHHIRSFFFTTKMRLFIAVFLVAASSVFSCPYASSNSESSASPHFKRSPGWSSSYTPSMSDVDWATLRANVAAQVAMGLGPKMIRAGFTDAASYNSKTGTGGPHAQSLLLAKNADALQFVRSLKTGISGYISNADVISFAAAAAVSAASNRTVTWRPGRADALNATDAAFPASDGQTVPLWNAADVRAWFARLGFTSDRDAVVLMGGHTLGNCHLQVSGYAGPWTTTPLLLTNEFYTRLVTASTSPSLYSNVSVTFNGTTKWQWADNRGRMMLPVDMNMIRDPTYFSLIKEYAADNDKFMNDFVDAYGRLLELGVASILLNPVDSSLSRNQTTIDKPESASTCYPQASNPIVCFSSQSDNKGSTIFTVHSIKPGWVAFGEPHLLTVHSQVLNHFTRNLGPLRESLILWCLIVLKLKFFQTRVQTFSAHLLMYQLVDSILEQCRHQVAQALQT